MGIERAVIFVNGTLKDPTAVKNLLKQGDYLVAADGGMRHLVSTGLDPDLVLGDLDSLSQDRISELQASGIEVQKFPRDKDQTDLELALQTVLKMGYRCILVIAALGDRIDQTLGNLLLLTLPELKDCDVRLDDGEVEVFLVQGEVTFLGQEGDIVSLIPLDEPVQGVSTSGLRYALRDERLHAGRTRGISNEMLVEHAAVNIKNGRLLCIHTRKGVRNEKEMDIG